MLYGDYFPNRDLLSERDNATVEAITDIEYALNEAASADENYSFVVANPVKGNWAVDIVYTNRGYQTTMNAVVVDSSTEYEGHYARHFGIADLNHSMLLLHPEQHYRAQEFADHQQDQRVELRDILALEVARRMREDLPARQAYDIEGKATVISEKFVHHAAGKGRATGKSAFGKIWSALRGDKPGFA